MFEVSFWKNGTLNIEKKEIQSLNYNFIFLSVLKKPSVIIYDTMPLSVCDSQSNLNQCWNASLNDNNTHKLFINLSNIIVTQNVSSIFVC